MDTFLKKLGLDHSSLKLAYLLGRDQGRKFIRGALIFPGIRIIDLEQQAKRSGSDPKDLIEKRDSMLDAILNFIEEFVDLDAD